jgi:MFS family permease
MLVPIGLVCLMFGLTNPWAALLFVFLFGLGNGMMTIVKGTAIAQYVSREHVASLNGALGFPSAIARAVMPWLVGVLWTAQAGYTYGLWLLLGASVIASLALVLAQRVALQRLGASSR